MTVDARPGALAPDEIDHLRQQQHGHVAADAVAQVRQVGQLLHHGLGVAAA